MRRQSEATKTATKLLRFCYSNAVFAHRSLGYVCEEYFVCSIEKIILEYQIPPDVAGATLMAAGSSSPELFAELVGCFVSEENSAGTGERREG